MRGVLAALLFGALIGGAAEARTLEQVKASGALSACLPANVLPYSRRDGDPPEFQVEVADAVARTLGVSLKKEWVISHIQALRADCDLQLDVIAIAEAQGDTHLVLSKSYYRSGVALVSRPDRKLENIAALDGHTKVAVQVGSMAAMVLGEKHIGMSMYAFEDEMLQAVADGNADAAMVTPASAGYYNIVHPEHGLSVTLPPDADQRMSWNIAIGLRRPDRPLREAIDQTIDKLVADGTMSAIYGRYGVTLAPPK